MKIVKPIKLALLTRFTRVLECARGPQLHVGAMIGFALNAPRSLVDEIIDMRARNLAAIRGENAIGLMRALAKQGDAQMHIG